MKTTTINRDNFGALFLAAQTTDADRAKYLAALAIVSKAVKAGKIDVEYDGMEWGTSGRERGHKIGDAVRHEVYDFTAKQVLVCVRHVEGTKYGQSTTSKQYFIVSKVGRDVAVESANKGTSAKFAKAAGQQLGVAIKLLAK